MQCWCLSKLWGGGERRRGGGIYVIIIRNFLYCSQKKCWIILSMIHTLASGLWFLTHSSKFACWNIPCHAPNYPLDERSLLCLCNKWLELEQFLMLWTNIVNSWWVCKLWLNHMICHSWMKIMIKRVEIAQAVKYPYFGLQALQRQYISRSFQKECIFNLESFFSEKRCIVNL